MLHFCFVPPPWLPSAVLFSVVRVRTLVIPEIPDCQIQKYFSTRALVYRYVYIINMPLLFLHCRQRSERIVLYCQINTQQIFIRWVTQCVPLTSPAGLNTNTRMMLHQETGRFTNRLPLKAWHAGLQCCNAANICMMWGFIFFKVVKTWNQLSLCVNVLYVSCLKVVSKLVILLRPPYCVESLPWLTAPCLSAGCWVKQCILGLGLL